MKKKRTSLNLTHPPAEVEALLKQINQLSFEIQRLRETGPRNYTINTAPNFFFRLNK